MQSQPRSPCSFALLLTAFPLSLCAVPSSVSASKHLLYSIDEVLRHGDAESYFKGIPMEKLEEMLKSESHADSQAFRAKGR